MTPTSPLRARLIALAATAALACGTGSTSGPVSGNQDANAATGDGGDPGAALDGGGDAARALADADGSGDGATGGETRLQPQWLYAGADVGTVLRAEAIPGRVFFDFDGMTARDPFDVMQDAGVNAIRVEAFIDQCAGPTTAYDNTKDVATRERNYQLDDGCIDAQVGIARLARRRGMKVVLTLNMGFDIPVAWQAYSYARMLAAIDGEVRRQLGPFVTAGVQPDIILLENEGTDGILFNVTLPNGKVHARGTMDSLVSTAQYQQELCGQLPTGNVASYPQAAGYYKQEIASSRSALIQAGFDDRLTRFGLHSHGQYVDWKQSIVYSTRPDNETALSGQGITCDFTGVIPDSILNGRADQMLDIMGFSAYPDPMTPAGPGSATAQAATLERLRTTLGLMDAVVARYGRVARGPFAGQWQKQGLGVEYATSFTYPDQTADQQAHTTLFFQTLLAHDWFLGALWWEPTYCFSNWEGGNASLYHGWSTGQQTAEAPTPTLTTWGSFARSP